MYTGSPGDSSCTAQRPSLPPPLPPDCKPMKINANCSPMEGLNPSLSCLYQELELWLTAAMKPGKGVTGTHDRLGGIFQGRVQPRVAEGLAALGLGKETCSGCFLNWKLFEKERVGYFGSSPRPLDPCISKDSELRWPRTFSYKIPMQTQPIQASKGNRGYDKQSPFVLHSPLRCSPELPSIPTHIHHSVAPTLHIAAGFTLQPAAQWSSSMALLHPRHGCISALPPPCMCQWSGCQLRCSSRAGACAFTPLGLKLGLHMQWCSPEELGCPRSQGRSAGLCSG